MQPNLSVIIVAHVRRDYIKFAIDSVLDQSAPRNSYEIIVVKNFSQQEYDHELEKRGIRVIITEEESLGSKIALGIENSSGEILSFLEDDDVFCRDKIKNVIDVMSSERVGYYHNGYTLIDGNGKLIGGHLPYVPRSYRRKLVTDTTILTTNVINKAFLAGGYFNLSCISIRKSVILEKLKVLDGVNVAVDNFMFFLGLDSGLDIVIDKSPLTKFRIHKANSSIVTGVEKSVFYEKKIKFFEDDFNSLFSIFSLVRNTEVKKYLSCRVLVPLLALAMLRTGGNEAKTDLGSALVCAFKIKSKELLVLILLNSVNKVVKNFGNWLFFQYENRRMKKLYGD